MSKDKNDRLKDLVLTEMGKRVLAWRAELSKRLGHPVFIAVEGAFKCNLFRGPAASRNPPLTGKEVIEIDYSVRTPDQIDPQDPATQRIVEEVLGVKHRGNYPANGWKQPAKQSHFVGHVTIPGIECPVEIDLCLQRESECCELSDYWRNLFTKDEIVLMRAEREMAESRDQATYEAVKDRQNEGAKFRLLLAFAMGRLSPVPQPVRAYVEHWFDWAPAEMPKSTAPEWVQEGWKIAQTLKSTERKPAEPQT